MRYISLLKVLTTLPVTTASAERTFSMLSRLKTWLKSTMAEDRLTGLALLASCTEITVTLDAVLDIVCLTSRRILNLSGGFKLRVLPSSYRLLNNRN